MVVLSAAVAEACFPVGMQMLGIALPQRIHGSRKLMAHKA